MKRSILVPITVLSAVLVSGCLSGLPAPSSKDASEICLTAIAAGCPQDPYGVRLQFDDCEERHVFVILPEDDAQSLLPPEYRAAPYAARGTGSLSVEVHECGRVQVGEANLTGRISVAVTRVSIEVNETMATTRTMHYYLPEVYATDGQLVQAFQAAGLPARLAAIAVKPSPQGFSFSVSVDGTLRYEAESGSGLFGPVDALLDLADRWHHRSPGGTPSWLHVVRSKEEFSNFPTQATLVVRDGPLKNLASAAGGILVGSSQPRAWNGSAGFGRLCPPPADLRVEELSYEWPFPGDGDKTFPLLYAAEDAASRILVKHKLRATMLALANSDDQEFHVSLLNPQGEVVRDQHAVAMWDYPGDGDETYGLEGTTSFSAWDAPINHTAGEWSLRIVGRGFMRTEFEVQTTATGFGC